MEDEAWESGRDSVGSGSSPHRASHDFKADAVIAAVMSQLGEYQLAANVERAVGIDVKTGEVIYDAIGDHASEVVLEPGRPSGPKSVKRFRHAPPQSVLEITAHGDDASFRASDWASFVAPQIGEARLIAKDAVYTLRKTNPFTNLPKDQTSPEAVRTRYTEAELDVRDEVPYISDKAATTRVSRILAAELGLYFRISER